MSSAKRCHTREAAASLFAVVHGPMISTAQEICACLQQKERKVVLSTALPWQIPSREMRLQLASMSCHRFASLQQVDPPFKSVMPGCQVIGVNQIARSTAIQIDGLFPQHKLFYVLSWQM